MNTEEAVAIVQTLSEDLKARVSKNELTLDEAVELNDSLDAFAYGTLCRAHARLREEGVYDADEWETWDTGFQRFLKQLSDLTKES